jgi:benzoylformate decarboxylase
MDIDKPVIDFSNLAESMGVKGERVERPEDLGQALKTAMASNEPRLVEVLVENRPT